MTFFSGFRCNVCGAEKGEVNHWWVMFIRPGDDQSLQLFPFEFGNKAPDAMHLCGQACVQKKVSEFMGAK